MADDRVRLELAFEGGQATRALVRTDAAEALERALAEGRDGVYELEVEDGTLTLVLARLVYVKRHVREARIGFAGT